MEDIVSAEFPSTPKIILLPWTWLFTTGEIRESFFSEESLLQWSKPFLLEGLGDDANMQSHREGVGAILTRAKSTTYTDRFIVL